MLNLVLPKTLLLTNLLTGSVLTNDGNLSFRRLFLRDQRRRLSLQKRVDNLIQIVRNNEICYKSNFGHLGSRCFANTLKDRGVRRGLLSQLIIAQINSLSTAWHLFNRALLLLDPGGQSEKR